MPDESAFLRTIIDRPDDDGPRLVYADWLEDAGRAERAEFIRVQVELATCSRCHGTGSRPNPATVNPISPTVLCCQDKRSKSLRARSRKLLLEHWTEWTPRYAPEKSFEVILSPKWQYSGTPAVEYRRGFPARVSLTLAAFVGGDWCQRCNGENIWSRPDLRMRNCDACSGTGTLPGLAAALAAACPLEGVVLTDKRPYDNGRRNSTRFFWWDSVPDHESAYAENRIPAEMFDLLTGHDAAWCPDESANHGTRIRGYPALADADAALSRACVAYTRALA